MTLKVSKEEHASDGVQTSLLLVDLLNTLFLNNPQRERALKDSVTGIYISVK